MPGPDILSPLQFAPLGGAGMVADMVGGALGGGGGEAKPEGGGGGMMGDAVSALAGPVGGSVLGMLG